MVGRKLNGRTMQARTAASGTERPEAASTHDHRCSLRYVFASSSPSPITNAVTLRKARSSRCENSCRTPSSRLGAMPCRRRSRARTTTVIEENYPTRPYRPTLWGNQQRMSVPSARCFTFIGLNRVRWAHPPVSSRWGTLERAEGLGVECDDRSVDIGWQPVRCMQSLLSTGLLGPATVPDALDCCILLRGHLTDASVFSS